MAARGIQPAENVPQHEDVCSATTAGTRKGWRQERGEGFRSHHSLCILPLYADPQGLSAALTVFEGQELKDAVHYGDDDGQRQQVGIRLQESNLEQASKTSLRFLLPNAPGIGRIQEDPASHGALRTMRGLTALYHHGLHAPFPLQSQGRCLCTPPHFASQR